VAQCGLRHTWDQPLIQFLALASTVYDTVLVLFILLFTLFAIVYG
jgi:hypothetical protein